MYFLEESVTLLVVEKNKCVMEQQSTHFKVAIDRVTLLQQDVSVNPLDTVNVHIRLCVTTRNEDTSGLQPDDYVSPVEKFKSPPTK